MKYDIASRPVWDAYNAQPECPLCLLEKESEDQYVAFYMGPAAMNPETRITVNRDGFCSHHLSLMYKRKEALPLALQIHSHAEEQDKLLEKHYGPLQKEAEKIAGRSLPTPTSGKLKDLALAAAASLEDLARRCRICEKIDNANNQMAYTIAYLFKKDDDFREALGESKGFCRHHEQTAMRMAPEVLSGKWLAEFYKTLIEIQRREHKRMHEELLYFIEQFDHENQNRPWGTAKDALPRSIEKRIGRIESEK